MDFVVYSVLWLLSKPLHIGEEVVMSYARACQPNVLGNIDAGPQEYGNTSQNGEDPVTSDCRLAA